MDVPAPVISAPQVFKKPCRSSISGSLAALESTVTPSAPQAASIRFSVAPTEGNPSTISRPVSFAALQCRVPPVSSISAPSARRPERCRSMGRGPNSQPPGLVRLASPHRARIAPRKITEDRISRISASGTSQPDIPAVSTSNTSPRHPALQPKACRIRMDASTSRRRGQRRSTTLPPVRMVAARMGSTLFFAPCMVTSPWRRFPPRISSRLILLVPPDENGITGHSMGREQLRFLPPLYQKG